MPSETRKVLRFMVTGSRWWEDVGLILDTIHDHVSPGAHLLVGDAGGADEIARTWWPREQTTVFRADWKGNGRYAGPLRNQAMVDAKPQIVLAFAQQCWKNECRGQQSHYTHGTRDAIARAQRAKIRVHVTLDSERLG